MTTPVVMHAPRHLLVGLALFVVLCAGIIFTMRGSVNSPDEAANILFARSWREHGTLFVPLAITSPDAYPLFPRSTMPVVGGVAPSGFVGQSVWYGSLSWVVGDWVLPYVTLLLTAVASLAWWYIARRVFGEQIAHISFWLFLFQPAVLYYTVRGMFPNMALLDLLIIAVAAAWHWWLYRSHAMGALAMCAALLAIAVRPPEALVLIFLCAVSAAVWGDRELRRAAAYVCGVVVAVSFLFLLLRAVGALPGGYPFLSATNFFPFGIHPAAVFKNASKFIIWLFAPWVVFSTAGVLWWVYQSAKEKKWDRMVLAYFTVVVPASVWLFVLYGSWQFSDNPGDPHAITLGASHVRYWLPHLVFRMPFAALLLLWIIKFLQWHEVRAVRIFLACVVALGVWRAGWGTDGWWNIQKELSTARAITAEITTRVQPNAVLAVLAWDKHFFPARTVLQPFPREVRTVHAARELLARGTPVWAFVETLRDVDFKWLAYQKIVATPRAAYGNGQHTLYELSVAP